MKKIIIYMPKLKYGGMELSLLNFLNESNIANNFNVDLYLINCENSELLQRVNKKVNVHLICPGKWNIKGKIITLIKLIGIYLKTPKSDIGICYSNHHKILADLTRKSSKNSILFVHSDLFRYETDKEKKAIKNKISFDKFGKIICVSKNVVKSLVGLYNKDIQKKCYVVPNYVDGKKILSLADEKIKEKIDFKKPTFISVANHNEKYKNINAIIDSSYELKKLGYDFQVLLVGQGKDTDSYIKKINELSLEDNIKLLYSKPNPYPYLKKSGALLFTSRYEGYGMVLDEARVLNVPIISFGSGASYEICKDGYGIITKDLTKAMIDVIEKKESSKKKFDYVKHNKTITDLYDIIIK